MDPFAFRLLNVLKEGEAAPTGEKWHDLRGREVLEEAAHRCSRRDSRPAGMGWGLALAYRNTGGGASGAVVTMSNDGSAEVLTGTTESGTGAWTILRQIAAEEIGIDPAMVRVVAGDTTTAPFDSGSAASRATNVAGWAVRKAAQDVATMLKNAAATIIGCSPEEISAGDGQYWQTSQPGRCFPIDAVVETAGKRGPLIGRGSYEDHSKDSVSFVAQVAEVRVDRETGSVAVTRLLAVHDIGRIINPPAAEGQVEGSVVQGMGFALWEDLKKQDGRLASSSLADYHQPTSLDCPEMEVVFLEDAPGPTPYGGKGIGEVPIVSVAAAVANAIEDATGLRMTDLPLTPEQVWRALKNKEGA